MIKVVSSQLIFESVGFFTASIPIRQKMCSSSPVGHHKSHMRNLPTTKMLLSLLAPRLQIYMLILEAS